MNNKQKRVGSGIITAMLTPLHSDETVDVESLKKIVNRMNDASISGIFTMSTSGECARLESKQQDLMIDTVAETNNGKSILYVGISASGLGQALRNLRRAEKAGADVIVSTLPYYYGAITKQEQVEYFKAISEATVLPILMYNIPGCVGNSIDLETVEAMKSLENIVGIKDSSGTPEYFKSLMSIRSDSFHVLNGVEFQAASSLKAGADGLVPSLSNIYPNTYMELWDVAQKHDFERVDAIQEKLNKINSVHKKHIGKMAVMACRKILMAYEGLGNEVVTKPYVPVPDDLRAELIAAVTELKLK